MKWLRFFVLVTLIIGIFFRFINLEKKAYWGDETFTSLQISGYTVSEFNQEVPIGKVISLKDLDKYQSINFEKSLFDTVKSLSQDVHPPLYYLILRFWAQCFGSSVAVIRSFSAIISLFVFPCIYWLCLELFESSLVGWIAITLIAVSPFHVVYAQEARMYSLWTVTILLSNITLLRAIRLKTKSDWGIYAATLTLGLYTFLFTGFVAIGHGIYVFVSERFRLSKTFLAYLLASFASLLAFVPWLLVIIINISSFQNATDWASKNKHLSSLVASWIYNLSYAFVDFWYIFTLFPNSPWNWSFGKYLIPLLLILVACSIYIICRQTSIRVWLFISTLIGSTALALILPDLILGGSRSIMARYFTPCYLGIQLSVAYLLATQLKSMPINSWKNKLWRFITIALVSGGVLSCTVSSQAEIWWNKRTTSYDDIQATRVINQANQPILIAENFLDTDYLFNTLSLSHQLDPKVKLLVVNQSTIPRIPDGFSNVFLYKPSNWLIRKIEKEPNYKIEMAYKGRQFNLLQIAKK
jgi:uncharacterized membrane protein